MSVDGATIGSIGPGLLVLVAVAADDGDEDVAFLKKKILNLRIFNDEEGKLNRSLLDVKGSLLVVSQFTLYGDCKKGNRPSYSKAAPPAQAEALYEKLIGQFRSEGVPVQSGRFQANMQVTLTNDGPVTLILDSKKG